MDLARRRRRLAATQAAGRKGTVGWVRGLVCHRRLPWHGDDGYHRADASWSRGTRFNGGGRVPGSQPQRHAASASNSVCTPYPRLCCPVVDGYGNGPSRPPLGGCVSAVHRCKRPSSVADRIGSGCWGMGRVGPSLGAGFAAMGGLVRGTKSGLGRCSAWRPGSGIGHLSAHSPDRTPFDYVVSEGWFAVPLAGPRSKEVNVALYRLLLALLPRSYTDQCTANLGWATDVHRCGPLATS